jgi:CRISPR-associated endonuclease/helicase Cas3
MVVQSDIALLENRLGPKTGFYPWQRRLLSAWLSQGEIPGAVDVPTGLGKTKVMALWLIALAAGARLPRRLVYVVDRRAVVDQATAEAEHLALALTTLLEDDTVDTELRRRWKRALGFTEDANLAISTLRGKFLDNRKWMDRPQAAAIVVGTVDMIGSRLLFSGYGISAGMRPVHAGLLGCDSLIALDEAHLVPPFEHLIRDIVRTTDRDRARTDDLVPPLRVMSLSATGRDDARVSTFALDHDDENDPPTRKRLIAEKRLRLLDQVPTADLADALAERAWALSEGSRRVLVFCNSRMTAQRTKERIEELIRKAGETAQQTVELFVGERRLRERLIALDHPDSVVRRFYPDAERDGRARFLVATSAAEVGVDLDADDLVCDLVAWERMVQRFGRVNRRSDPGRARIEIIPSISEKDAEDVFEREQLETLRAPFESPAWTEAEDGSRDASPLAIQSLRNIPGLKNLIDKARSPEPLRPEICDPLVEAWSMTSLREHSGRPIIQPWIRGWIETRPQCRIAWRSHFPLRDEAGLGRSSGKARSELFSILDAYFAAAPPDATELLEAPADRVADLLAKRIASWLARHGKGHTSGETTPSRRQHPVIVILDDRYDVEAYWTAEQLQSWKPDRIRREILERTIIIDADLGGLSVDGLLDNKADARPRTTDADSEDEWLRQDDPPQPQWRVRYGKPSESGQPTVDWKMAGFRWSTDPEASNADTLWVEVWRGGDATSGDAAVTRFEQMLAEHHSWTEDAAGNIAESLSLPESKVQMLRAAAVIHDSGKSRSLWQDAMNARKDGRPYAKTVGGAAPKLLAGYRHEFGSLSDAGNDGTAPIRALIDDDRELALHLVATHHGHSRPQIRAFDPETPPSQSAALARISALRYMKLQQRWGAWGLAWWEALLRSADWTASRKVNEEREPAS